MSSEELLKELLSLPVEERARIAEELLASLEESEEAVEAAWVSELERRSRDIAEGRVKTIPWEVVKAELEQDIQRLRDSRLSS